MMPIKTYHLTSLVIGITIAGIIFFLIRKDRLHIRYSLWWVFVAMATAILGSLPWLVDFVSTKLGIAYPPILLMILGMGFLLVKMLTMDIERSEHERKIRILSERLAIMEGESDREDESHDEVERAHNQRDSVPR
jgi:hypothetical protein